MTSDQAKKWLALLGESQVEESAQWVNTHCPLAVWTHDSGTDRTPSFGVSVGPGESKVYCFTCTEARGMQTDFLLRLSGYLQGEVHSLDIRGAMRLIMDVLEGREKVELEMPEDTTPEPDYVFPESFLELFPPAYTAGAVHPYLEERWMPYAVAEALDIRFDVGEGRVVFPIRNFNGDLVGMHGRAVSVDILPRYRVIRYKGHKNMLAWLGEHWINPEKPVVIAESVFDLARVYQVYRNVTCPLSAGMSRAKVQRMSSCFLNVVTMFDQGKAGDDARRKIGNAFESSLIAHVIPAGKDPGDMTPHRVAEQLEGLVDLDEILL